jgi:hypothetical protein
MIQRYTTQAITLNHDPRSLSPGLEPHDPSREMPALAASAAHALNNLLAVLFAASSYLEDENPSAKAVGRARAAVASACATGEALGAGLALLAVGGQGLAVLASARQVTALSASDFGEIGRAVSETTAIDSAALTNLASPVPCWLDRDTLKAMLVCAGVTMRRRFGKNCEVALLASVLPEPRSGCVFEFRPLLPAEMPVPVLRPADHPCTIALQAVRESLVALGSDLDFDDDGCIRIGLRSLAV